MNSANQETLDNYLEDLKRALSRQSAQSEGIVAEVRADLESHVERLQSEGSTEEEAVAGAIDEIGNPYEIAHQILEEIPPFGGDVISGIRYVAACGVILWVVFLLWTLRAGVYGFSPKLYAIIMLLHLPAVLLLWPRIVWRKNWLFGLIPAAIALMVVLSGAFGGVESSQSSTIPMDAGGEILAAEPSDTGISGIQLALISTLLLAIGFALLMAIQRRSQRRFALVALMLVLGGIEAVFQVEEWIFRKDRERLVNYLETAFRADGAYPANEVVESQLLGLKCDHLRLSSQGEEFHIFWSRPLSSGHSIVYSSGKGGIRIQD